MRGSLRVLAFFLLSMSGLLSSASHPAAQAAYAPVASAFQTEAPDKTPAAETAEDKKIRQAIFSRTDVQQLQVSLRAKLGQVDGDTRALTLVAHLDVKSLRLRKQDDRNLNTVAFVFAIFDAKGKMLKVERRDAKVDVTDSSLPDFLATGIDADVTFQLKPGAYLVRQVVMDSEENHMATEFRKVNVPPM